MGTIAANPSVMEVAMLTAFGVLGSLMRRYDFPIAPVVVGLILGPVAESQLRRALSISLGDPMVLLQSPISATFLVIALIGPCHPVRAQGTQSLPRSRGLIHTFILGLPVSRG